MITQLHCGGQGCICQRPERIDQVSEASEDEKRSTYSQKALEPSCDLSLLREEKDGEGRNQIELAPHNAEESELAKCLKDYSAFEAAIRKNASESHRMRHTTGRAQEETDENETLSGMNIVLGK